MSRTDKDLPYKVLFPEGWPGMQEYKRAGISGDSGFRKYRKWLKRARNKSIRRYKPEASDNGAKPPYNGTKRTWDFE